MYRLPIFKYAVVIIIFSFIINYATVSIIVPFYQKMGWWSEETFVSIIGMDAFYLIGAITWGPIIETYLFQVFPIKIMLSWSFFHNKLPLVILISGFVFGIIHVDLRVVTAAIPIGALFSYTYIIYEKKSKQPVLFVIILHSVINVLNIAIAFIRYKMSNP